MQRYGFEYSVYSINNIHLADFRFLSDAQTFADLNGRCKIWCHDSMNWIET